MYFKSRVEAGQLLAKQIVERYKGQECSVVALNDGGVIVGAQIALQMHCPLMMLLTEAINLPRENAAFGGISQDGSFTYNRKFSQGEIDEFAAEYYQFIEQEKMNKLAEMHRQLGKEKMIRKDLLKERNIILVSDGMQDGFALDIAVEYLKPIHTKKVIMATPLASVPAVDRIHVIADDIFCLSVIEDYISTDHYYDTNDIPPHDKVVKTIEEIVGHWK
jgi:putative phosphoribosyl transferase